MFNEEAYLSKVEAMTAEERYTTLVELYTTYAETKLRPPCTTTVGGKTYRVVVQVTTPSLRGIVQFPSYHAVHEVYLPKIEAAKVSGEPVVVPLHLLFVPKERELLIQISILQNNISAEQLEQAELDVARRSRDPAVQEFLAEELADLATPGSWNQEAM